MRVKHGQVINRILYKRGKAVVKFWKHNGYAIPVEELQKIDGVKLYTQYDGNLYASKEAFDKHGIVNLYDTGKGWEHQIVLELKYWEPL